MAIRHRIFYKPGRCLSAGLQFHSYMDFAEQLISWYGQNQRSLPWRNTKDPYRIWLSEIILQQTRVNQGLPYYQGFLEHFPKVGDLASASEQEVLALWQGLGYYSRARNLHAAAKIIQNEYGGVFPADYQKIKALPGIGPYTAAAIASFAFNLCHPVVDGNVIRFICRLEGIYEPVQSSLCRKKIEESLAGRIDRKEPGAFNQAIMEFGALACTPLNPLCRREPGACPFAHVCHAFAHGAEAHLPVKEKKKPLPVWQLHYVLVFDRNDTVWLRKRGYDDLWRGMYDLPVLPQSPALDAVPAVCEAAGISFLEHRTQVLSHRKLHFYFYKAEAGASGLRKYLEKQENCFRVKKNSLSKYAFPISVRRFLKDLTIF